MAPFKINVYNIALFTHSPFFFCCNYSCRGVDWPVLPVCAKSASHRHPLTFHIYRRVLLKDKMAVYCLELNRQIHRLQVKIK